MTISESIVSRGIQEVLHFTTSHGLIGILHSGSVKSRERLPHEEALKYTWEPNARIRYDPEWLDYVNLSISSINLKFFETSCGWHRARGHWWAILSFDPTILTHPGVYFATTNNRYSSVIRESAESGFERLFAPTTHLYGRNAIQRQKDHAPHLTTCPQAEALYPQELSLQFLRAIYVTTGEDQDEVHGQLAVTGKPDIPVLIDPSRFGRIKA